MISLFTATPNTNLHTHFQCRYQSNPLPRNPWQIQTKPTSTPVSLLAATPNTDLHTHFQRRYQSNPLPRHPWQTQTKPTANPQPNADLDATPKHRSLCQTLNANLYATTLGGGLPWPVIVGQAMVWWLWSFESEEGKWVRTERKERIRD